MKSDVVLDLRLALPALVSWILLSTTILSEQHSFLGIDLAIVVLALSAFVIVMARFLPRSLWLSAALTAVLVGLYALLRQAHIEVMPWQEPVSAAGAESWDQALRRAFSVLSTALPGTGGELLPGLSIGETSRVTPLLDSAMKTVSLSHITAVSGANCVIVTATVMTVAGWLGFPRYLRLFMALCALMLFVILVTPDPSVIRAAIMSVIVLFALFIGRPSSGIPLLAVAVVLMLIWDPWWAIDFGFILSVSATAGLLLFSQPLIAKLSVWMPWWGATLIAIPLAAQLLCQPFIILLSAQMPTYGIVANVMAAPAAPLATIFGLLGCVTTPLSEPLALIFMWIAWIPSQWIALIAETLARFPFAAIAWPEGVTGALVAGLLSTAVLVAMLARQQRVRLVAIIAVLAIVFLHVCMPVLIGAWRLNAIPQNWHLAFCDVGQGDAIVVKSNGHTALIDTGPTPQRLSSCLRTLNVQHLDYLFLTHFDRDHAGGVDAVIGSVEQVYLGPPEDLGDQIVVEDFVRAGANVVRAYAGQQGALGQSAWTILWPERHRSDMSSGNAGSVTVHFQFETFSALFLGDLDERAQDALLAATGLGHVEVVKVAHHGSADQSPALYQRISPNVGVFSVGRENRYGHPRLETLNMLESTGALTPRTDESGMIVISPSATGLSVWSEH